ncbi:MAG: serine/threonine-protein kinase [Acidobacteriota bacterium]
MMRYQLERFLGAGGFGDVWLATDTVTNQNVAIKFLRQVSRENLQRFQREARIYWQEQDNQFIVKLLNYDFSLPNPYMVLEYCERGSLRSWMLCNWYDVAVAIQHAALGLASIHQKGGIHRDIKPDNLFVSRTDKGLNIKVGDFGYGRLPFPFTNSVMTCSAHGTDGYIAPELYCGSEFNPKCDIYSLGITGIELITGSKERDSITRPWISGEVKDLLIRMTSSKQEKRPDAEVVADTARTICQTYQSNFKTVAAIGLGLLAIALFSPKSRK